LEIAWVAPFLLAHSRAAIFSTNATQPMKTISRIKHAPAGLFRSLRFAAELRGSRRAG
jgi:hypothetical protein